MAKFEMTTAAAKRIVIALTERTNNNYDTVLELLRDEGFTRPRSAYRNLMAELLALQRGRRTPNTPYLEMIAWLGMEAASAARYQAEQLNDIKVAVRVLNNAGVWGEEEAE